MTPEELKELRDGIKRLLRIGATYDQIHDILVARKWDEEDIALVLDPAEKVQTSLVRLSNPFVLIGQSFKLALSRFGNLFFVFLSTALVSGAFLYGAYWLISHNFIDGVFDLASTSGIAGPAIMTPIIVFGMLVLTFFWAGSQVLVPTSLISGLGKEKQTFKENLSSALSRVFPFLAVVLLVSVLVALGSVFLIIPGLIALAWLFFAPALVVKEKTSALESLLVSQKLVRGRTLGILVRIFILALTVAIFLVVCVGLVTPLLYINTLGFATSIAVVVGVFLALIIATYTFMLFLFSFYNLLYQEIRALRPEVSMYDQKGKVTAWILIIAFLIISAGVAFFSPQIKGFFGQVKFAAKEQYAEPIKYDAGTLSLGGEELSIALADTNATRRTGLSRQQKIEKDQGLLFVFEKLDNHGIWMRDMNFPIDIIWLDEDLNVVGIEKDARPESFRSVTDAETFYPPVRAKYVLEVASGFSERTKLEVGATAELNLREETVQ